MSVRKILNASSGTTTSTATASGPSDASFGSTSLLLTGDPNVVDPNFASVSLLLTGNDLLDKSNNKFSITNSGTIVVSNTTKKFGTGSLYFPNSGRLTITDSTIMSFTGNFTIEGWIICNSNRTQQNAFYNYVFSSIDAGNWSLPYITGVVDYTGKFSLNFNAGGAAVGFLSDSAITKNIWHHFALVRSSGTLAAYLNGVSMTASGSVSNSSSISQTGLIIGDSRWNTGSETWDGYIDDFRITKGVARYTTNFTPPVQALPSHEILDSSVYSLPVTTYGNARIDTATKKYGTGSMYFDGTGDYVTIPSTATGFSGDFTVEGWCYYSNASGYATIFDARVAGTYSGVLLYVNVGTSSINVTVGASTVIITGATPAANTWFHFALSRSGTSVYLFINGSQVGTTATNSTSFPSNILYLGAFCEPTANLNGYIDDFRITKGTARYTANFTPPTAALPTIPPTIAADPWWGNVSLLLDGNTTDAYDPHWQNVSLMLTGDDFIDWSNNHYAVTKSGAIATDNTIKKYNSGSIKITTADTDFATANTGSALGSSNFTIEFWFRSSSTTGYCAPFMVDNTAGGYAGITFTRSGAFLSTTGNSWEMFGYGSTQATASFDGNWHHVALCRSTVSVYLFIDGVSVGAPYNISTNSITATPAGAVLVGKQSTSTGFTGNIADFRITKGVARYTANFTPPIAALPSYKIQDRTQNNLTLTPYGNVQLSTDVKKNGTGSMFFDGTSDYLSTGTLVTGLQLGTGDFTAECWVYHVSSAVEYETYFCGGTNGFDIRRSNTGKFEVVRPGVTNVKSSTASILSNQWVHVCAVRISGTTYLYINGVLDSSVVDTNNYTGTGYFAIGSTSQSAGVYSMKGYIDDLRITKGVARYTSNFTPPSQSFATQYISTGFDPNYADASLLLTGEGTNGSTTFTDLSSSPKTITPYGNAQISTAQKKYGTGSMSFGGSGSYIAFDDVTGLGSNNFTIDFWMYVNASGWDLFSLGATANTDHAGFAFVNSGVVYASNTGSSWQHTIINCGSFPLTTWIHMAFVRDGNSLRIYNNGALVSTTTISGAFANNSGKNFIGVKSDNMTYGFNGYVDDFRITKNVVRYTTNFTPPTYALATTTGTSIDANRADTSLLLRGNGTNGSTSFTDESPNNLTVTNNGSVTVNTTTKKYGTGSISFSGSNYLSIPNSSRLVFGAGDFTVEAWINLTSIPGANVSTIAGVWDASTGYGWIIQTDPSMLRIVTTGLVFTSASWAPATNIWYHIAVSRSSGSIRIFVNGTQIGTTATVTGDIQSTFTLNIGMNRDGGNSSLPFNGYVDDLRITKGYARYTANFTPPTYEAPIVTGTEYDYNYAQVILLLNGDGTNGSTKFTDLSSNQNKVTASGTAQVSTSTKKFGTGSIYLNGGSTSYLDIPYTSAFNFTSVNFTIEAWVNIVNVSPANPILSRWHSGGDWVYAVYGGKQYFGYNGGSLNKTSTTTLSNNTWYHVAVVLSGTTLTFYLNGTADGSFTGVTVTDSSTNNPQVGQANQGSEMLNGYIDDLRVTRGIARYTQNFTPPTAPLPTSGGY